MLPFNKKIKFFSGLFLFVVAALLLIVLPKNEVSSSTIANLNSKHGLVFAESLDEKEDLPLQVLFSSRQFLRANLINVLKPEKELILKLNSEDTDSELQNVLILNFKTNKDIEQIAADYEDLDLVKYAEPNFDLSMSVGEVIDVVDSGNTELAEKEVVLEDTEETTEILVAVVDSGVDSAHPDFKNRVVAGWNFLDDTQEGLDQNGHGTHVAGIILENSIVAKIMPLKVSDGRSGKMKDLARAIKFAVDNGAQIINLSLGLQKESQVLQEAIDYADERGVIVVAATGNYRSGEKYYPAAFSNVIAVSALKKDGEKLFLSNFGEWVDFSVVAQDVWNAAPCGEHAYRSGTSQAAPVVSAKIADVLGGLNETHDFQQVYDYLIENSELIDSRYELGRQILTSANIDDLPHDEMDDLSHDEITE